MRRLGHAIFCLWLLLPMTQAGMVVTPWQPLFKGIDRAVGTNFPDATIPRLQVANCVRVDLTDPDVRFYATPRATNYLAEMRETYSDSVSNFMKQAGLQIATTANFYNSAMGYDPARGAACQVYGLAMSAGQVVSVPDFGPDSNNRYASMLFTTNNTPSLVWSNGPPGTNTAGIYTAVSGYYPVLTNGVVLGDVLSSIYPDPTIHEPQPRTVFGLSQDQRYFYILIIDGRQPGYSEGALDAESGTWLLQFGGWDGINMDGGGSTALYMADCAGNPLPLGHSSYIAGYNRERYTGSQLGLYARPVPAFINDVLAVPGSVTATITWGTVSNATTQLEYGTTTNYGTLTPLDSIPTTNHVVTLSGLSPLTRYYFRVLSLTEDGLYQSACPGAPFTTTNFAGGQIFALTKGWKYSTGNLDGVNWMAPSYDDAAWPGGPGALWADWRTSIPNSTNTIPNFASGTRMPINAASTYPFTTYYFRTPFVYSGSVAEVTLVFSNYLDDGAVFYLNGGEIFRTNMPMAPALISNGTFASGLPCGGNATCPIVFSLTGNALSNLVVGTNLLAVEVHNVAAQSSDITFEMALLYTLPPPMPMPPFFSDVVVLPGETNAVITWVTLSNSASQVLFGTTPLLGLSTPPDTNLVRQHVMVLDGLKPLTLYYFRIVSTVGTNEQAYDGTFATVPFYQPLLAFSNTWKFTTNQLDGEDWTAPDYEDDAWTGQGPALLYAEDNVGVAPRNTPVPLGNNGLPYPTYYFRTHFTLDQPLAGFALGFTNYIDDGAVLYLNGHEIQRIRMPGGTVGFQTLASGCPLNGCEATVDVPDLFRLSGEALTNLVVGGDNVLAAEVHQRTPDSTDIVFGVSVGLVRALAGETKLTMTRTNGMVCVSWPGEFLKLQQASDLTSSNAWSDVPGPVQSGFYCVTNPVSSVFYRLRN